MYTCIFVSLSSLFDVKRPKGVKIQLNDQPSFTENQETSNFDLFS